MSEKDRRDLRRRLSRLRANRDPKPVTQPDPPASDSVESRGLPEGEVVVTGRGEAFRVERRFALDYQHGPQPLSELLAFAEQPELAAQVGRAPSLARTPLSELAFLDTETTGLVGGAGTLVFLIGVGRFLEEGFVLRQYFLRDPAQESGMLEALREDLKAVQGFVTFNGRAFDLPLLEMRYVLGLRDRLQLTQWPHLDLLHPSRRLWRRELPDCRLSTLELRVLGVRRSEDDVPGSEIPGMYLDYLRTGDAHPLQRVVYHNEMDVLSLVGLTTEVLTRHREHDPRALSGGEALAVGRWHDAAGRQGPAEEAYHAAVGDQDAGDEVRVEALRRLGTQLKRQERYEDAIEAWLEWHERAEDDPRPCIELAKYYEWKAGDLDEALRWAKQALVCLSHRPEGWRREERWKAVEHRLQRLRRKLDPDDEKTPSDKGPG